MDEPVKMEIAEAFHGDGARHASLSPDDAEKGWVCFSLTREVAEGWASAMAPAGSDGYLYRARLSLGDVLVVKCRGAHWSEIRCPWGGGRREIDSIVRDAFARGFSSVMFRGVLDSEDTADGVRSTTVFVSLAEEIEVLDVNEVVLDVAT